MFYYIAVNSYFELRLAVSTRITHKP